MRANTFLIGDPFNKLDDCVFVNSMNKDDATFILNQEKQFIKEEILADFIDFTTIVREGINDYKNKTSFDKYGESIEHKHEKGRLRSQKISILLERYELLEERLSQGENIVEDGKKITEKEELREMLSKKVCLISSEGSKKSLLKSCLLNAMYISYLNSSRRDKLKKAIEILGINDKLLIEDIIGYVAKNIKNKEIKSSPPLRSKKDNNKVKEKSQYYQEMINKTKKIPDDMKFSTHSLITIDHVKILFSICFDNIQESKSFLGKIFYKEGINPGKKSILDLLEKLKNFTTLRADANGKFHRVLTEIGMRHLLYFILTTTAHKKLIEKRAELLKKLSMYLDDDNAAAIMVFGDNIKNVNLLLTQTETQAFLAPIIKEEIIKTPSAPPAVETTSTLLLTRTDIPEKAPMQTPSAPTREEILPSISSPPTFKELEEALNVSTETHLPPSQNPEWIQSWLEENSTDTVQEEKLVIPTKIEKMIEAPKNSIISSSSSRPPSNNPNIAKENSTPLITEVSSKKFKDPLGVVESDEKIIVRSTGVTQSSTKTLTAISTVSEELDERELPKITKIGLYGNGNSKKSKNIKKDDIIKKKVIINR